jgi:Protein of unknown function (DUF1279)
MNNIFNKGFSSIPETNSGNKDDKLKEKPKNIVKEMMSKYGYVAIGTYLSVYLLTLGSIFTALDFDIFNAATFGLDPLHMIKKVCDLIENTTGNTSIPAYINKNPTVGTFAIAWIMTKFTEPVRLGLTILIVPKVSRILGRS